MWKYSSKFAPQRTNANCFGDLFLTFLLLPSSGQIYNFTLADLPLSKWVSLLEISYWFKKVEGAWLLMRNYPKSIVMSAFSPAWHLNTHIQTHTEKTSCMLCLILIFTMLCWRYKWYTVHVWDRYWGYETLTLTWKSWTTESVFVMTNRLVTNLQHSFFDDRLQAWSTAWIMQWQLTPNLIETSGPQTK